MAQRLPDGLNILLTNDDGLESPGLRSVADHLTELGANVEIVVPASNISGCGNSRSSSIRCEQVERGHVVDGTSADCVAYAVRGLEIEIDLVVSGCNLGPNAGLYVLCQSGTVGAAVEAAWLGLPAIAVSAYALDSVFPRPPENYSYEVAGQALERFIPAIMEAYPDDRSADYLNVNVPVRRQGAGEDHALYRESLRLTLPDQYYDTTVREEENSIAFKNDYGPQSHWIDEGRSATEIPPPPTGSTQAAIRDGCTAVTPLQIPYQPIECPVIQRVVSPKEE